MNDRELLDLAAKAAGFIDDATDQSEAYGLHRGEDGVFYTTDSDGWREWNPITDDGDALRLAAALDMLVSAHRRSVYAQTLNGETPSAYASQGGQDQMANIRRAIVRAAAEIGRSMP